MMTVEVPEAQLTAHVHAFFMCCGACQAQEVVPGASAAEWMTRHRAPDARQALVQVGSGPVHWTPIQLA